MRKSGKPMQRDVFKKIIDWNNSRKRKPLILMGARQVGKTWLMDAFANEFYPGAYVKVDLQRDDMLRDKIDNSNIDPKTMLDLVQAATGKQIVPGQTLLIIDEIQESHKTLNSLKYFAPILCERSILCTTFRRVSLHYPYHGSADNRPHYT